MFIFTGLLVVFNIHNYDTMYKIHYTTISIQPSPNHIIIHYIYAMYEYTLVY